VTLPREVCAALGLTPGEPVVFMIEGEQVRLARSPADFGEYLALLGASAGSPGSTEDE
jgi:bifunctional DNA-binding transcriptional regulator/antitoxin component of YhaV-PrlF toxin-antitoxin module